jgi:hypothetical protein
MSKAVILRIFLDGDENGFLLVCDMGYAKAAVEEWEENLKNESISEKLMKFIGVAYSYAKKPVSIIVETEKIQAMTISELES